MPTGLEGAAFFDLVVGVLEEIGKDDERWEVEPCCSSDDKKELDDAFVTGSSFGTDELFKRAGEECKACEREKRKSQLRKRDSMADLLYKIEGDLTIEIR